MSSSDMQTEVNLNGMYYLNVIAFTLLFYDYFLTFEWEISRYWSSGSKISWPTVLFFLNRYGSLLGNIPVTFLGNFTLIFTPGQRLTKICIRLESYHQYFLIAIQLVVGVLLVLRTYALYERNNRVLAFMLVIGTGAIGVCIWRSLVDDASNVLVDGNLALDIGCTYAITGPQSIGLIIAWMALVLFDSMIFFLTLYRALSRRSTGTRLFTVLLRDGSIYFGVMVITNTSNILTFAVSELYIPTPAECTHSPAHYKFGDDWTRGVASTFANTISSIMLARLMLNLRDPVLSTSGIPTHAPHFSDVEFSTQPFTSVFARSRNIDTNM
ncbi:hypothetical protein B0H11DRAFT_2264934 [Mycena galericulata]|nr:hypothetical protein B0H11DRAFT_2264934 [Mycena galericulata]